MTSPADKVVGIIGGLGPAATFDFCQRIVRLTEVGCEQDHLQLLVDNNPKAPDRNRALAGKGPTPEQSFAESAQRLVSAGADFLVMPCNTAHAFASAIHQATNIPLVHMVDICITRLPSLIRTGDSVGLLAVDGCLRAGLYQERLKEAGFPLVVPDIAAQQSLMETVYGIKQHGITSEAKHQMKLLAEALERQGAECIIAGCTEVPLVLAAADISVPLLDPRELLAAQVVNYAKNRIALPNLS